MPDESKTKNKSLIRILIITAVLSLAVTILNHKSLSIADYVDKSGNIVVSKNNSFSQWIGQEVPDFTVTDIEGNKHSISDYRGKNLVVLFWATWCPPCRAEIPHLIELRNQESEDNLAMLAISNEDSDTVINFAKAHKLNYTAATLGNTSLPRPFAEVRAIPTSFFIEPDGKIKTVVVQSLNLEQIKTILNAKLIELPENDK